MPYFKCSNCQNTLEAETPPETCPACQQKCAFIDVTCYTPECGGPGSQNINPDMYRHKKESGELQS
ncbi:rubredoxin-like domain-containing protein [Desulfonatronum thioautotrophicum]|uniref:rubredoxin-like domain-containing protein n=1 Tax=Desulfonatronum thioautotrophicum TaxID=617001 RepID=UPI0005EAE6C9|nr:hypothetical protein [Desulfonatronum thioautotrophicum]